MTIKKLLVIIPDRLSDIVGKGEVIDRYYNPGNVFNEVHIVMTNDDVPDKVLVQKTVGDAKLFIYNAPAGKSLFISSLGWQPFLLKRWALSLVDLARKINPSLIRCHGAHLNAFAASCIKHDLGIPYLVSLHINPDEDVRKRVKGFLTRYIAHVQQNLERIGLRDADLVMPVYRPIVPYLERLGVEHYQVCYNALNPAYLKSKDNYQLHSPIMVISVGRQFAEKNPDNLIKAIASLENIHLTLVGDGQLHEYLKNVVKECRIEDRVEFYAAIPNDELCRILPDYDIFAVHTEYWEISKSVLEPLLTGLPVIINRRKGAPVPELTDDICMLVDNTVEGYRDALSRLITDHDLREQLGRKACRHAQENWAPAITEAKFARIYQEYMRQDDHATD